MNPVVYTSVESHQLSFSFCVLLALDLLDVEVRI